MANENSKKTGGRLENLVTGVIIGGAVGSVLGLALAPRKGSETRQIIKDKSKEIIEKGKEFGEDLLDEHHETIESAKTSIQRSHRGLLKWVSGLFKKGAKSRK